MHTTHRFARRFARRSSILSIFLVLLLSVSATGTWAAAPTAVTITPTSKNFGSVAVGASSAVQSFTLKNSQKTALTISSISTTLDFPQTNTCAGSLAANAQCTISVRFAPTAVGARTGTLTITDNASNSPQVATLSGAGTAPVTLSPSSLTFGPQLVATTSVAKTVSVTNNQSTTLTIASIYTAGDFAQTNTCGSSLGAGATCTVNVTFTPTAAGARTGTLTVADNARTSPYQTTTLSGTGSAPGLTSIAVTPTNSSVPLGNQQQFVATGKYNNGTTQDLTTSAVWSSSATTIATISNAAGSQGRATTVAQGTTTITATGAGGIGGSTTLTVTSGAPLTISCPADISVPSSDGAGVAVTYRATTTGGMAPLTVSYTPLSGSNFAIGTSSVTATAQSSDGQTKSCGFSVTVAYFPPLSTGIGPQSTITCPADAIDIYPGTDNIQAFVDTYPGGTTFCLRAGVFVVSNPIAPKTGDTFVGEYGAVLDGTGWSSTETTHGAFRAFMQDIDYVTIRNLVIRNMPQCGIHAFYNMSDHWTIEYNEIGSNGNTGIVFPSYSLIRNNYIHHNSVAGYQADSSHFSTLESNEIAYNGWEQKIMQSANVTFRNNFVHHNIGPGIWYDSDNTAALIEGNLLEDNGWMAIFYEVSTDVIIRNNTVRRTADTAIFISTSKNAQIYNNTLENNFRGITYFLNCPALGGGVISNDLANNSAHHNTVLVGTQSGAYATVFSYAGPCTQTQLAPYASPSTKGLTFSSNSYDVPSPAGQYWYWSGNKFWSEWQALGLDGTSTVQ